jgi:hypothetical protein
MKNILYFLLFTICLNPVWAQDFERCSSNEYEMYLEKNYPNLKKLKEEYSRYLGEEATRKLKTSRISNEEEEVYKIPVVVHIIHSNISGIIGGKKNVNIPDEQVYSQIDVLNQDFRRKPSSPGFNNDPVGADTKIEFCLASRDPNGNATNGINRIYHSKTTWNIFETQKLSELSYWPSNKYLNIWVTNLPDGTLGYAQFPESPALIGLDGPYTETTDGVVIDYEFFGTTGFLINNFNMGRTTTHEVGHWLGLRHIWGDRFCGTDYVDDTPVQEGPNNSGTCTDSSDCNKDNIYTPNMSNNYMDYSYDRCMNLFTEGQKARMRTVMKTSPRRKDLLNSAGCCDSQELVKLPYTEDFELGNSNWEIYAPSPYTFQITSPGAGNSNMSIQAWPHGVFSGDTSSNKLYTYLTSPSLDFKTEKNPVLNFDLAYATNTVNESTDSLVISYRINCDRWITLKTLSGQEIITSQSNSTSFVPIPSDWKHFTVPLDILSYKSVVNIRFEAYSKNINTIYIDNIEVFQTAPTLSLTAYPNTAHGFVNMKFLFSGAKDISYTIYSVIGVPLYKESIPNKTSFIHTLNISGFPDGIYIIKATDGKETDIQRIVVKN